jgi:hypothetical protein
MRACLLSIDSLRKNYDACESKCDGDACAENICKETSRNVACAAIKARCSSDGDNRDGDYLRCCKTRDTCELAADAPCRILPTTTSSTTSTSTSTATQVSTTSTTRA